MWRAYPEKPEELTQRNQKDPRKKVVALFLKLTPMITRRRLAEQIGISENGIKYHLNKLKSGGVLRHAVQQKVGIGRS